jgi:PQQ-dependent dehydrogenase (methanol/ethanol family)
MGWRGASGRVVSSLAIAAIALGGPTGAQPPAGAGANVDWPLHNLDIRNSRYAPLDEINASNAARLAVKWSYDAGAVDNIGRNTPLVVDGVMYVDAGSKLFAVDAATGRLLWNVQIDPPFPASGRGPIYADGRIYAYGQSILYAIDAKSGRIVESFGNKGRLEIGRAATQFKYPDKDPTGYQLTASPAYFNGTLYVGLAQSEHHIPGGLVVAVDGRTGAIKWAFNTVPQGPEDDGWPIASRTWSGGVRHGGGVWSPPAIDAELGLVYVNAGNPSPDYDGSARKGMNLFTNSILALTLQTGKLAWYYQTIHHEIWDFDLVTGPLLFDVTVDGRTIKGVASAGKNCLLYLWQRDTGRPINPMVETPVATATDVPGEEVWPTQPFPYTAKGVPMQPFCSTFPMLTDPELLERARPLYTPYSIKEMYIVSHGGSSFGPMSFSPRTGLLYVTGKNAAVALSVKPVGNTLRQNTQSLGHFASIAEGPQRSKDVGMADMETVTAYHPGSGQIAWQREHPTRSGIGSSGNLATGGDLIFQGSDTGDFYAYHARSGEPLFKYTAPRSIRSNPITYRVNGRQYVTIVATNTILTYGLP